MNSLVPAAFLKAPWLPVLGWALVHSLWEGALVAGAAALVLRGMGGASPRARYAVAVLALVLFAGLPLRRLGSGHPAPPPVALQRPEGGILPRPAAAGPLGTRVSRDLEGTLPWVVAAYGTGLCLFLFRLGGGWVWLQRKRWRRAELAPDALQRQMLDLCRRLGMKRVVTLLCCRDLPDPCVVGYLRPAILVPVGWFLNLPPDQVEALLAHELAHVLRNDYLVNLLQSLLEALFFYHPAFWWLSGRIRLERERICDGFATRLTGDPLPLAEALLLLERRGPGRASLEPAPAAHGGLLMKRIQSLLLPPPRTSSSPLFGAVAALILLAGTSLRLGAQPSNTPPLPAGSETASLVLRIRHAQDSLGQTVPYALKVDLICRKEPLLDAWKTFQEYMGKTADGHIIEVIGRDHSKRAPLVDLDLQDVTPTEAQRALERLARENGVSPDEAAPVDAPKPCRVAKRTLADGSTRYTLYAQRVSAEVIMSLLEDARRLERDPSVRNRQDIFDYSKETFPEPRFDAFVEDCPLKELEGRVRNRPPHETPVGN